MSTYHDGPFPAARPTLCTAQYSVLQQERLYLHRALADEERRKERLTGILRKIEADITAAEQGEQIKTLEKSRRNIRSKLNRSERVEQSLSNSLEAVIAQMQRLDNHQYRRAHHDYAQQTQYGQMISLAPAAPAWPMASPAVGSTMPQVYSLPTVQNGYYQPQGLYNPVNQGFNSQIPPTPILRPMQYTTPQSLYMQPYQFTCGSFTHNHRERDGISPSDTVSTYSLSPWVGAPPEVLPTAAAPSTQVFDIVQGHHSMNFAGEEVQNAGYWIHGQPLATGASAATQQLQMLGSHSTALRPDRKARKRSSV